ncbi:dynamin family protein [Fusobacterium polymorphum]|uniref:dynamin family protein n=1 Tax=Fusobacterium nucleatum subsp. polymorphum TaxID=76857 RepID=UPI00300AC91C
MSISDIEIILNFYKEFKEKNVKEKNMIKNSIDTNVKKIMELFEEFKKEINQLNNKAKTINLDLSTSIELDKNIYKKIEEIKNREFKIFVTGEAKSGKSTFINAFLGEDILPTGFIQCTSSIIEIRRSKDGKKRLISEEVGGGIKSEEDINKIKYFLQKTAAIPDEYRDIPFNIINDNFLIKYKDSYNEKDISNFLYEIKNEKKNLNKKAEKEFENKVRNYIKSTNWRKVIKRIILEYPLEKLKEVTIFDTPGVGAEGSLGEVTRKYIKEADAIIFVKALAGQDIETTSFKNFLEENISDKQKETMFLVFTHKNDTKEDDLEQFENRLNDTFYKILKKDNVFKLDSLIELHLKEYEKFSIGEELEEFLKNKIKEEKEKNQGNIMNSTLRAEKSILTDDCDYNLTDFFEEMKKYSDFYKFRDKLDKFVDEAHYLKLISFLEMLKKNCEKGIGNLNLILKSCEENKGNLEEIKNSIEKTKGKISDLYLKINDVNGIDTIPFFKEKYTSSNGKTKEIAKNLLNDFIEKMEIINYTEATITKELENFYDYINSIKEKEFKSFVEEMDAKILEENKKLDLSLEAFLPKFNDEEIKDIFDKAANNSYYYEDVTGMIRGFFNWITLGYIERKKERRKDPVKEKKLILENLKKMCEDNLDEFEKSLAKTINYAIDEYKNIIDKNLTNAEKQLDSFLKDLKTTEEMIEKINLTKKVVNYYKEKQNKFSSEIQEIENVIGKN